jgi:hypothetical protein
MSVMKIEGSGSTPKCHGSATLLVMEPEPFIVFFLLFISFFSGDVPLLREEVRAHPLPGGQEGLPLRSNLGISRCSEVAN